MGNKFYQRMDHKIMSHQITISEDEFYGYLFWNKTKLNDVDYEVYYSSGNGGNKFSFQDQLMLL
jgi:hypothetical protein